MTKTWLSIFTETWFKIAAWVVQCSTLLVPLEKLVPPCDFGQYPLKQYLRYTEIQSHACTNLMNPTKAIWIIMFKLGELLIFGMQEEIQTSRKSTDKSKKVLKKARLDLAVGLCLRLTD